MNARERIVEIEKRFEKAKAHPGLDVALNSDESALLWLAFKVMRGIAVKNKVPVATPGRDILAMRREQVDAEFEEAMKKAEGGE